MRYTTTLFIAFLFTFSMAQTPEWTKTIGAGGWDSGKDIAVDDSGNVYITGYFTGSVDFDPGSGTANLIAQFSYDSYVLKLDSMGNFIWAIEINASSIGDVNANSIVLDDSGNIYIAGYFKGSADFDPGAGTHTLTSQGDNDIFIHKMDASGNFIWAKSIGGQEWDSPEAIALDDDANIYITGYFNDNVDFDPGVGSHHLTSQGNSDIFILKLTTGGDFDWAKGIGSTSGDIGYDIIISSNYLYVTGSFNGTVNFDPAGSNDLTSQGNSDAFVLKMETIDATINGNFIWAKSFGGNDKDFGLHIAADPSGNIYTSGVFKGTSDFNPGQGAFNLSSSGNYDVYIQKLTPSGNFTWAKSFGGSNIDYSYSIALDRNDNIYTTGYFAGTSNFHTDTGVYNLSSNGSNDCFIQKTDASGNFIWARNMGGTDADIGNSSVIDNSGYIYIVGGFKGTSDLDPGTGTNNITSQGDWDFFITKWRQCTAFDTTINAFICRGDSFYAAGAYQHLTNTFTDTLTGSNGCDSISTVNLTVFSLPTSLSITGSDSVMQHDTLFYSIINSKNSTYVWSAQGGSMVSGNGTDTVEISWDSIGTGTIYILETDSNGCVGDTFSLNIHIDQLVGTKANPSQDLLIYTKYFNGHIIFETAESNQNILSMAMFDISGNRVRAINNINSNKLRLEKGSLSKGVYFVDLRASGQIYKGKVFIN